MAVRPIVETRVMTEFGEVVEDANFYSATVGEDHTYVKGYSDMRKARDTAIAAIQQKYGPTPGSEQHEVARRAELYKLDPLPVRLHWTRSMRVSGNEPDNTKELQAGNDGYRVATKADIGSDWLKELPAGAKVVAGGAIRKGDVTLMVCDRNRAARNAAQNHIQVMREAQDLSKRPLLAHTGAAPYIESTVDSKPIGQA